MRTFGAGIVIAVVIVAGACSANRDAAPPPPATSSPTVVAEPSSAEPPASAPPASDSDRTTAFLAAIDEHGGVGGVGPPRLVVAGTAACDGMAAGHSRTQVVAAVRAQPEAYTAVQARTLIDAAADALCPGVEPTATPVPAATRSKPKPKPKRTRPPTSGEVQFEYGCQQGYIPKDECGH